MEAGCLPGGGSGGGVSAGDSSEPLPEGPQEEPWLNAAGREKLGAGVGSGSGRRRAAKGARTDREPPPGGGGPRGGGGSFPLMRSVTGGITAPLVGNASGGAEAGRSPLGVGVGGVGGLVDQEAVSPNAGGLAGSPRVDPGGRGGAGDVGGGSKGGGGGGGGGDSGDSGDSCLSRPRVGEGRRGCQRRLGKVVGVPQQAKANDVRIMYDACAFARELEVKCRLGCGLGSGDPAGWGRRGEDS